MAATTATTEVAAPTGAATEPTARERLLAAASELFYEEGIHTVGIDRVIERAGVAKATLYSTFGSKDELVRAYLQARHASIKGRMDRALAERWTTPRERLLGVFDVQADTISTPGYRGCAFLGASAESPRGGTVEEMTNGFRGWLHELLAQLATEAGVADPESLARQLALLYDGVVVTAWMDRDTSAAVTAKEIATGLVDAALAQ